MRILSNPEVKKYNLNLFLMFIASIIIMLFVNIMSLNIIKDNIVINNQAIVGNILSKHPELENEIVDIITQSNTNQNVELGKEVLEKYNYKSSITLKEEPIIKNNFSKILKLNFAFIIFVFISFAMLSFSFFIDLYNDKYMDVLSNNYKCKEIYVSLMKDDVTDSNSKYKEELAEIDMYNIRYLSSKNEIVCNLVKQNIQDERIILELNSKFITMKICFNRYFL